MSQDRAADEFQEALLEDDPVQLYERAPCGYLSTTPDGRITKVNATFATWTGFDVSELVGRQLVDLLSVGGRIYYETHYAPLLRMQGSVREIAVDVVRAGGDRLPVLLNARLDRGPDDQPRVVRIAVFDATERRAYELELLRAKEAAEVSERRASSLARTLQETLIPPLPRPSRGWTSPRRTDPPATAPRSAATSTTSSRSGPTTGSWCWATSAAREQRRPWSRPWCATPCGRWRSR